MNKRQFILLMSVAMFLGIVSYNFSAFSTFGNKEEGESGLVSMVAKLTANFNQLKPVEAGTVTTVLQTTYTNTFATAKTAIPYVHLMSGGTSVEAVVTVATTYFTVPLATNTTFQYIVAGS